MGSCGVGLSWGFCWGLAEARAGGGDPGGPLPRNARYSLTARFASQRERNELPTLGRSPTKGLSGRGTHVLASSESAASSARAVRFTASYDARSLSCFVRGIDNPTAASAASPDSAGAAAGSGSQRRSHSADNVTSVGAGATLDGGPGPHENASNHADLIASRAPPGCASVPSRSLRA